MPGAPLLRALCLVPALSVSLLAIVITPPPANFVLDGNVREWNDRPPNAEIGARPPFAIWLARGSTGLLVAGRIPEPGDDFAKTTEIGRAAGRGRGERSGGA